MSQGLLHFKYEIELKPGEKFQVPAGLVELLGPGRWVFTIKPAPYEPYWARHNDAEEDDDDADDPVNRSRGEDIPF